MKLIFVHILSLFTLTAFCQNGQVNGQIAKQYPLLEYKYLTVLLQKGQTTINGAVPDSMGQFGIKDIPEGIYSLVIKQLGYRDAVTDSIVVSGGAAISLSLLYPPPCKFKYIKGQKPLCEDGHIDQIIPIVYGLPTKKTMRRAEKGLLHLAGCLMTDCDPQYYCKIHKREF
jgi:hypothetical protein